MTYDPCGFATPLDRRTFPIVTGLGLSTGSLSCRHKLRKSAPTDSSGPETQLYNMKQDPSETKNLAEAHPEIVERLTPLLEKDKTEDRSAPQH